MPIMKRGAAIGLVASLVVAGAWTAGLWAQAPQGAPPAAPVPGQAPAARGPIPQIVIGPPAPVPPEVARPSAAETDQINEQLRKLIDGDKSSAKALLKKQEDVLMLLPPRLNVAATYTQTGQRMGQRHLGFVDQAKAGNIDLLLDGDSITDFWQQDDNKPMYEKYFGKIRTADFAISGDTTQGVLWGLHNGEGQGFQPKAIMLMIGTNNTGAGASNTAAEIAEGVGAVVLEMRNDFPNAKILLLAIFPRGNPGDAVRDKIAVINKIIARLDDQRHVFFMDIGPKFLDEKGVFLPSAFRPDNLHPLAKGYDIWGEAVQAKLAELMK